MHKGKALAFALLAASAGMAGAQSQDLTLSDVAVTATRIQESTIDAPAAIAVVTAADIAAKGATTVAEALEGVPGLTLTSYGPEGSVVSASIRGSTSNEVVVLIDGVRVANALNGTVDLSTLPADNIERIEVLRAGASALYGPDAVGGVINIITNSSSATRLSATVENGAFVPGESVSSAGSPEGADAGSLVDSQKLSVSGGTALGAVGVEGAGTLSRAGNAYLYTDPSGITRQLANAGLLGGDGSLALRAPLASGTIAAEGAVDYSNVGVPGSEEDPSPSANQQNTRLSGTLGYTTGHFLSDLLTTSLTAYAEYTEVAYVYDPTQPSTASDDKLWTYGADLQEEASVSDALTLVYGLSLEYDSALSTDVGSPTRLSSGVYFEPSLVVGKLSIVPAIRYDYYSDYAPGDVSGMLGFSYRLSDDVALKLDASRAYRVPTFEDLYTQDAYGDTGNPNLLPESGWSGEIGVVVDTGRLSYSGFVFTRYMEDLIVWETAPDFTSHPYNIGAALYPGAEQELKLRFAGRFYVDAAYTFLDAYDLSDGLTIADNVRLPYTPEDTASLAVGSDRGPVTWRLGGSYASARFEDSTNTTSLPPYFVLDALVRVALARGWSLYVAADNVLGEQYQLSAGYPMPPTEIRVGANLSAHGAASR